ncbi:MAG: RNA methyltransferase [Deltaproteobacteria bacterium]|nr:RNA methyltransferase [Deltaproteobacteria bacterium]
MLEALRARRRPLHGLVVRVGARGAEVERIQAAARDAEVPVESLEAGAFERSVPEGVNPQGVLLRVGPLPEPLLDELVPEVAPCTLVALDGVEDPQNLGAIARVADAAGAAGLIVTRRRSPPLGAAASRASAGALEWLPVARVPNLTRALNSLKERDFWIYGADAGAPGELFGLADRVLSARRVVVLGAEGRGLREGVLATLDHRVRIPMRGHVRSLNVATAAAVLLYELARRGPE